MSTLLAKIPMTVGGLLVIIVTMFVVGVITGVVMDRAERKHD